MIIKTRTEANNLPLFVGAKGFVLTEATTGSGSVWAEYNYQYNRNEINSLLEELDSFLKREAEYMRNNAQNGANFMWRIQVIF